MDNIPIFNQNGLKAQVGSSKAGTYSPSASYTVNDIINGGVAWKNIDLITFLKSGKPTVELVETLGSVLYVGTYKINEIIALLKSGINGQFLGANLGNPEWQNFPIANKTTQGITQFASSTEYFDKNNTKAVTSEDISNDVRLAQFSVRNNATAIGQNIRVATPYNMLTPLLEANEIQNSSIPIIYKNTANAIQNTLLNQTSDILFLPSPLYTFNLSYIKYTARVQFDLNIPSLANNQTAIFVVSVRRVLDNVILSRQEFTRVATNTAITQPNEAGLFEALLSFFVNGEADPATIGGVRIFLHLITLNGVAGTYAITLVNENITIFRD